MDPCEFVRLIIESLALKLPARSITAGPGVHPSSTPCYVTLALDSPASPTLTAPIPLASSSSHSGELSKPLTTSTSPTTFSLDATILRKPLTLTLSVYAGRTGSSCGFSSGRLLGKVRVNVCVNDSVSAVVQSGWVSVGRGGVRVHMVVRTEPDPRFVFQFGGEPECSPVVYQLQGTAGGGGGGGGGGRSGCLRQPVFSCRFSADRRQSARSRSLPSPSTTFNIRNLLGAFGSERSSLHRRDQRKGWTVTIHDLSGSPVAAASMVTPFVPSPNSDRVSRSNPGAWIILHPSNGTPWARLQAWRERGPAHALGYRFELVTDSGPQLIAESSISVRKGGNFKIDGCDVASTLVGGFVMGSTVEGEGRASRPAVQIGVQHVTCMADAALFVALAAAVDLSMDACQLFSHKLRKELCQDWDDRDVITWASEAAMEENIPMCDASTLESKGMNFIESSITVSE